MITIFERYKKYRKRKYEKIIKKNVLFNEWRIESYKNYPNKIEPSLKEFKNDEDIISYACCKDDLKFCNKIGIDKELSIKFYNSDIIAMKEYDNLKNRIKKEKQQKDEQEKIKLYKEAILELKQEGKL